MNNKMVRLTTQLAEQFAESAALEGKIKKNLEATGQPPKPSLAGSEFVQGVLAQRCRSC